VTPAYAMSHLPAVNVACIHGLAGGRGMGISACSSNIHNGRSLDTARTCYAGLAAKPLVLYNGPTVFPKIAQTFHGDLDPHLIRGFLSPPKSTSERHLNRFGRFAGLTIVTDGPTDRQTTCSVCNNRPHLRTTAMRPKID